jgi:hypothetical protein
MRSTCIRFLRLILPAEVAVALVSRLTAALG